MATFLIGCGRSSLPDATITAYQDGVKRKLADFHGKPLVLDFWATWCGPCRETLPKLQEYFNQYSGKGLEVAAVTTDLQPEITKFLMETHFTFPIYLDADGSLEKALEVDAIPVTLVVDKDGGIVWRGHPGDEDALKRAIESVLN
jgi:thiol-disulfide isomerase/thioredoxin